jgi:ribonuclease P protein subunit POP4
MAGFSENNLAFMQPLPVEMTKHLDDTKEDDLEEFLAQRISFRDHGQIDDVFKRRLFLEGDKTRKKWKKKPRVGKHQLTAKEKRNLGLDRLPKTGLQFTNFTDLSNLWLTYMRDLLGTDGLIKSGWSPGNLEEPLLQTLQMKVTRADFHGAIMKVVSADCPTQVGRQGICLMETRHVFQILSADNRLRMIPKKGSAFSIEVSGFLFTFPGSSMISRPAERSTKKPKNKPPLEF